MGSTDVIDRTRGNLIAQVVPVYGVVHAFADSIRGRTTWLDEPEKWGMHYDSEDAATFRVAQIAYSYYQMGSCIAAGAGIFYGLGKLLS